MTKATTAAMAATAAVGIATAVDAKFTIIPATAKAATAATNMVPWCLCIDCMSYDLYVPIQAHNCQMYKFLFYAIM